MLDFVTIPRANPEESPATEAGRSISTLYIPPVTHPEYENIALQNGIDNSITIVTKSFELAFYRWP